MGMSRPVWFVVVLCWTVYYCVVLYCDMMYCAVM